MLHTIKATDPYSPTHKIHMNIHAHKKKKKENLD